MATLFLRECDVQEILTMDLAIDAVEQAFRWLATGEAMNIPRRRARTPSVVLHTMSAASVANGTVGLKAYTTGRSGSRFHVLLYSESSGELRAIIEADWLGRIRTGAASGVATGRMARCEASALGVFGSGAQARTQIQAICNVREIREVRVYSRDQSRREQFARELEAICETTVIPVTRPEEAALDMDIIVTATTAREPVLRGDWIRDGTHVNAIGSNALARAELDVAAIRRADTIAIDSIEQGQIEAGDFADALEQGVLHWANVVELAEIVAGRQTGRATSESVTLFKSLGLAVEDIAVAERVVEIARQRGAGMELPI